MNYYNINILIEFFIINYFLISITYIYIKFYFVYKLKQSNVSYIYNYTAVDKKKLGT